MTHCHAGCSKVVIPVPDRGPGQAPHVRHNGGYRPLDEGRRAEKEGRALTTTPRTSPIFGPSVHHVMNHVLDSVQACRFCEVFEMVLLKIGNSLGRGVARKEQEPVSNVLIYVRGLLEEFKTIHDRHIHIRDDDIEIMSFDLLQTYFSIFGWFYNIFT